MELEKIVMLVALWCSKVDPTRGAYCTEVVTECVFDGETKRWCYADYVESEYLLGEE